MSSSGGHTRGREDEDESVSDAESEFDTTFRVDRVVARPSGYRVVVVMPGSTFERAVGASGTITLGRGSECVVPIDHRSVSRVHAEVVLGPTPLVRDLQSANGVRVGGKSIAPGVHVALGEGELLELGAVSVALTPLYEPASERPRAVDAGSSDKPVPRGRTGTPVAVATALATAPLKDEVAAMERTRILEALERHAGNQTRAAESLGMPRRTFVKRLGEYGIARPRKGGVDGDGGDDGGEG